MSWPYWGKQGQQQYCWAHIHKYFSLVSLVSMFCSVLCSSEAINISTYSHKLAIWGSVSCTFWHADCASRGLHHGPSDKPMIWTLSLTTTSLLLNSSNSVISSGQKGVKISASSQLSNPITVDQSYGRYSHLMQVWMLILPFPTIDKNQKLVGVCVFWPVLKGVYCI